MVQADRLLVAAVILALIGILQFVALLPIAMDRYHGGSLGSIDSQGYSWSRNWLSDLGRSIAWDGTSNNDSARLFNGSTIALGLSLMLFFFASVRAADELTFASWITSLAGMSAALGLIGIGMTPFDRYHSAHLISLFLWILSMVVVAVSFGYQCLRSGGPLALTVPGAGLVLLAGLCIYAYASSTSNVMAAQKLFVIISLGWFVLLIARVMLAAIYVVVKTRSRLQIVNEQANQYMRRIEGGHLQRYQRWDD